MRLKHYLFGVFLLLQTVVYGKSIEVAAGPFAYFGVDLPSEMVAGQSYKAQLTAYDVYGNKTNYFGENGRSFELATSGSIAVTPQRLDSGMFGSGSVSLTLTDRISEAASLQISEGGKALLVKDQHSGEFTTRFNISIGYAPLSAFAVALSDNPVAGEPFNVTVTAKDAQANTIADYGNFGKGVTVAVAGRNGTRNFSIPAHSFEAGVATVALRYDYPEAVTVTATEVGGEERGSAGPVKLKAQVLTRIEVTIPTKIRAGVLFPLELTVYNQFGRVMKNYAAVGSDLVLQSNGTGRLIPDRVPASAFNEGHARFETLYTKPEVIEITATPVKGAKPKVQASAAKRPAPKKMASAPVKTPQTAAVKKAPKQAKAAPSEKAKISPAIFGTRAQNSASSITPLPDAFVQGTSVATSPKKPAKPAAAAASHAAEEKAMRLSLRFSPRLGNITRIASEYRPKGKLGVTYITAYFSNGAGVNDITAIRKEIRAKGRVIGTIVVDGRLHNGALKIRIDEKEPFTVNADHDGPTLKLSFFLLS